MLTLHNCGPARTDTVEPEQEPVHEPVPERDPDDDRELVPA